MERGSVQSRSRNELGKFWAPYVVHTKILLGMSFVFSIPQLLIPVLCMHGQDTTQDPRRVDRGL